MDQQSLINRHYFSDWGDIIIHHNQQIENLKFKSKEILP